MSEKDILKEALELMADVCSLLFETESEVGKGAAFMADALLKYINVIHKDGDVLSAAADYQAYEERLSEK
jgi:hypothetical protein